MPMVWQPAIFISWYTLGASITLLHNMTVQSKHKVAAVTSIFVRFGLCQDEGERSFFSEHHLGRYPCAMGASWWMKWYDVRVSVTLGFVVLLFKSNRFTLETDNGGKWPPARVLSWDKKKKNSTCCLQGGKHCCCPWGRTDGRNSHFCRYTTILHSVDLTNACTQFDSSSCDDRRLFMLRIQTSESADPCRERTVELVLFVFFLFSVFPTVFVFEAFHSETLDSVSFGCMVAGIVPFN